MSDGVGGEAGTVTATQAATFLAACFGAGGLSATSAERLADALIDADLSGLPSHGILQAPIYLDRLCAGSISTASQARIVSDREAAVVLDAEDMFGHLVGDQAIDLAVEKALHFGVGTVAVRNSFHFGAAGRYARRASEAGCIGVATCNTRPLMPAPGGAEAVVGNNPLAIGLPAGDGPDFLLDMALSAAAFGKIRAAANAGRSIPPGWAVDNAGETTTDAEAAIKGMLLPAGGAKGYGLALALDLIASGLSDGPGGNGIGLMYGDVGTPFRCSLLFIAIHIGHFQDPAKFADRTGATLARIRATRSRDGTPVRTPGSAAAMRDRQNATLTIPAASMRALDERARTLQVEVLRPKSLPASSRSRA